MIPDLISRLESLEARLASLEQAGIPVVTTPVGLSTALATPATHTSWDGKAKTSADNGILDLSALFGIPAGVLAVDVLLVCRSATAGRIGEVGPSSTYPGVVVCKCWTTGGADFYFANGRCPCDANGDIYFYASGDLAYVYLQIWGYVS